MNYDGKQNSRPQGETIQLLYLYLLQQEYPLIKTFLRELQSVSNGANLSSDHIHYNILSHIVTVL